MTSLYQLSSEYQQAALALNDLDLPEQAIADTLEGLSGDLEVKAKNVAMFIRNIEATAESIKQAESEMSARRKAIENRAARLREYLKTNMEACAIEKIECQYFQLAIKKNPPAVDIFEPGLIPSDYMTDPPPPPPAPDKKLIAQALKDGFEVPGCKLKQGTRLDIK